MRIYKWLPLFNFGVIIAGALVAVIKAALDYFRSNSK